MVVCIDLVVTSLLMYALYRLNYLEHLTVMDLRNDQLRVEDFSILLNEIPVSAEDYKNEPDLLAAQIVTHMEDIVGHEL
jgi:hypothetical protein